jgi:(p)ppGpp synthase/HD superfamily hydrolase
MMEAKITKHPSFPWPDKPWLLSGRFVDALEAAAVMFADKKRKGCDIPYISHLLAACAISLENGATEDEAIAALFHDAIEDIEDKSKVRALVGLFGPEVLRIVEACSDTDKVPKPPWRERKEAYLARLLEEDRSVLLVSAADKLHNARSIAADLRQHGAAVWERFNAPLKEQLWYYRELVGLYRKRLTDRPALVDELERAVSDMEKYPESP